MGKLEEKQAKATRAVVAKLDRQIRHLSSILKTGHPDVARHIDLSMTWAGVSRMIVSELASAAEKRSKAAQDELGRLRKFIDGRGELPSGSIAQSAQEPADQAQSEVLGRARELLRPVERVHLFDRAVVLKVWSEHVRVLAKIAGARDLAGLVDALESLAKAAAEKASGAELLGVLLDLLDAARKRQRAATAASELFDYLEQLNNANARWTLAAQCQILRLESATNRVPEDEIMEEASHRVMKVFRDLWSSTHPAGRS